VTQPEPQGGAPVAAGFPPALLTFARLFNGGAYWESHEALEGAWRETRSDFYKGLILLASAYVHVERGNPRGVIAQLHKAERHLAPYPPAYAGVDVAGLVEHARRAAAAVGEAARGRGRPPPDLGALVPRVTIALGAERVRGDEPELAGG